VINGFCRVLILLLTNVSSNIRTLQNIYTYIHLLSGTMRFGAPRGRRGVGACRGGRLPTAANAVVSTVSRCHY